MPGSWSIPARPSGRHHKNARLLGTFTVLLDLKIFAACDDLWGGPPGPRPTPPSARFWLRLGCSVGRAILPAAAFSGGFLGGRAPAESRRQPGLAAPLLGITHYTRNLFGQDRQQRLNRGWFMSFQIEIARVQ